MNSKTKQVQAYEWMLERNSIPQSEREQIVRGAELFFNRGWPSHHFTIGMAKQAGQGLVPPIYDGPGSEGLYFKALQTPAEQASAGKKGVQPERLPCLNAMAS